MIVIFQTHLETLETRMKYGGSAPGSHRPQDAYVNHIQAIAVYRIILWCNMYRPAVPHVRRALNSRGVCCIL